MNTWKSWLLDRAFLLLAGIFAAGVGFGMILLLGNDTMFFCSLGSGFSLLSDNIRLRKELKKLRPSDGGDNRTPLA